MSVGMKPGAGESVMVGLGVGERGLLEYLQVLVRRRWWVLGGFFAVVLVVAGYNETAAPRWGARSVVLMATGGGAMGMGGSQAGSLSQLLPNPFGMGGLAQVETQVSMLRSEPMLSAAVGLLQKQPEFVRELTEGKKKQLPTDELRKLMDKYRLKDAPSEQAKQEWRGVVFGVSVAPIEGTSLLQVQASSEDARQAADAANAVATVYLVGALDRTQRTARSCLEYIDEQLQEAEGRLEAAEMELLAFSRRTGSVELDKQVESELGETAALRTRRTEVQGALAAGRARLRVLQGQLAGAEKEVMQSRTLVQNPVLGQLEQQLVALELERSELAGKYTSQSTRMKVIEQQIGELKARLQREAGQVASSVTRGANPVRVDLLGEIAKLRAEVRANEAQEGPLSAALSAAEQKLARIPDSRIAQSRLQRELQLAQDQYLMLRQQQEQYRLAEQAQVSGAELVEPALLARRMLISPKKMLNVMVAVMVGVFVGLLLGFVVEHLDDTYADAPAAEGDLGLAVIGLIPQVKDMSRGGLITQGEASRGFREGFLSLHSNVGFASAGGFPGTVMVTSSSPGEGKTTVAANFGLAAAEAEQRVVLVDGDLRRPRLHEVFGLEQGPGLSNVLVGQASLETCLRRVELGEGRELWVLPAGPCPPTPQALLDSRAMDELLKELRGRADLVAVDAPPLGSMSDAQILGSRCEAVLLVMRNRGTKRPLLRNARALLVRAGANVAGLVVNRVQRSRESYYSYGYYGPKA